MIRQSSSAGPCKYFTIIPNYYKQTMYSFCKRKIGKKGGKKKYLSSCNQDIKTIKNELRQKLRYDVRRKMKISAISKFLIFLYTQN